MSAEVETLCSLSSSISTTRSHSIANPEDLFQRQESGRQLTDALFLDFETELADILGRRSDVGNSRKTSRSNSSASSELEAVRGRIVGGGEVDFDADGTLPCARINFNVLCALTGRSSLSSLNELSLCVKTSSPAFDNLALLSYHTPRITTLKLDHSRFDSLRVLGDELPSLRTLSVCGCGLTDLDGVQNAANLVTLVAADNALQQILPVTEMRKIETLDLENNFITTFDSVSFLFLCPKLEYLVLRGNPIAHMHDYRNFIFRILPDLKSLDVLTTPRVAIEMCRRVRRQSRNGGGSDDDDANGQSGTLVKPEEDKPEEEEEINEPSAACPDESKKSKKSDKLISQLMRQTSVNTYARKEKSIDAVTEDLFKMNEDQQPKSLPIINDATEVESHVESPKREEENYASAKEDDSSKSQTPNYGSNKLLNRRKSLDPAKIQTVVAQRDEAKTEGEQEEQVKLGSNLGLLMLRDQSSRRGSVGFPTSYSVARPDSSTSMASTSTITTSDNSSSSNNTDSGIDASAKFKGPGRESLPSLQKKHKSASRIEEEEEEERLAKRNKHLSLARENAGIKGKTSQAGDIEIEDYDVEMEEL